MNRKQRISRTVPEKARREEFDFVMLNILREVDRTRRERKGPKIERVETIFGGIDIIANPFLQPDTAVMVGHPAWKQDGSPNAVVFRISNCKSTTDKTG